MKKISLCCLFLIFTISCAKITYKDNEFKYSRIGMQSLEGLIITKLPDGTVEVKVQRQKGNSGKLGKLFEKAGKLMLETGKMVAAGGIGGAVVK